MTQAKGDLMPPLFGNLHVPTDCHYDERLVDVEGWEYSANGWDGPHFSPRPITHKVVWVRPRFVAKARIVAPSVDGPQQEDQK